MKFVINRKRNLDFHIIREFIERRYLSNTFLADDIAEFFKNMNLTAQDLKLVSLVQKENPSQTDLDKFLSEWDIEEEGGGKSIYLAYFMKEHTELNFPKDVEQRLKGLLDFYKFMNMEIFAYFKKAAKELQKENIDIMIFKGAAMKFYRPDLPRVAEDIDILVRNEEDYKKASEILSKEEFSDNKVKHSIYFKNLEKDTKILDVHYKINILSENERLLNDALFSRAKKENVFGLENIYVPCEEDMFFILFLNLLKNFLHGRSGLSIFNAVFDSKYILKLKPDFDWNIVKKNAEITKTEPHLHIGITIINNLLQNKIHLLYVEEFFDYATSIIYNKWFLKLLKEKSKQNPLPKIFRDFTGNIKDFFEYKTRYFLYKRKFIRNNKKTTYKILKKHEIIK